MLDVCVAGKKNKLRVYYLSWLRNKILHNDPEVEKKQGWTTVGDLEGCVHYNVGRPRPRAPRTPTIGTRLGAQTLQDIRSSVGSQHAPLLHPIILNSQRHLSEFNNSTSAAPELQSRCVAVETRRAGKPSVK